jgi:hypothetical protein
MRINTMPRATRDHWRDRPCALLVRPRRHLGCAGTCLPGRGRPATNGAHWLTDERADGSPPGRRSPGHSRSPARGRDGDARKRATPACAPRGRPRRRCLRPCSRCAWAVLARRVVLEAARLRAQATPPWHRSRRWADALVVRRRHQWAGDAGRETGAAGGLPRTCGTRYRTAPGTFTTKRRFP